VDVDDAKLDIAKKAGADYAVNTYALKKLRHYYVPWTENPSRFSKIMVSME
jgi:hypothetical protein